MNQKKITDTWERGEPYEQYVGRWSRKAAPKFLAWLNCPANLRWLDVGCGTGALSAAILDQCSPAQVAGVEPSAGFRKEAGQNLAGRVVIYPGSADDIPLESSSVDVVVSGLVLNFVPDPCAALAEMARVTRGGGLIAAYVWDYAGKMEILRHFWSAAAALDPEAARMIEGVRFPLCHPDALEELFTGAGLHSVETAAVDVQAVFAGFEDYWQPFLGGQGPAPSYVAALDAQARTRLRDRLREQIPAQPDGTIAMLVRAWAVRGVAAKEA